jgi:hypothetical protein
MLAGRGEYGLVTALSGQAGVSRQSLYQWSARAEAALATTLGSQVPTKAAVASGQARLVLTLLAEGHASARGVAACLGELGQPLSLGSIQAILAQAEERALALVARQVPAGRRDLACDELYGHDRHAGYLSVVDAQTGAVWGAVGPVGVDKESWTLLFWDLEARGLRWGVRASDGGAALAGACAQGTPDQPCQRDVWHILHVCSKVQGRLDQAVSQQAAKVATAQRQAAVLAAGGRLQGFAAQAPADLGARTAALAQAQQVAAGLRYLSGELHRLLEVVVLVGGRLYTAAQRAADLAALLALLADLQQTAPAPLAGHLAGLHTSLSTALPGLLAFVPPLETIHQQAATQLRPDALALVAWAWQRRAILGPDSARLLADLPPAWRPTAALLLHAWDQTTRASSLAETWHSVLRPHLAVHRTLSPGLLALLVVYHNHRIAPRGLHKDTSPLSRSGITAPADWLVALGYPPAAPGRIPAAAPLQEVPLAA